MNKLLVILIAASTVACKVQGQYGVPPEQLTSDDKKAIKYFEKGYECFTTYSPSTGMPYYGCVEENFLAAIERDPNYTGAYVFLAAAYQEQGKNEEAIDAFAKILELDPMYSPYVPMQMGELQLKIGRYEDAQESLNNFIMDQNVSPDIKEEAMEMLRNCAFAIDAINNPKEFEPVNMGPNINSDRPEYFPSFTADDNTLLYTRLVEDSKALQYGIQEDFYVSNKVDGEWQVSTPISSTINTIYNEGAPTLSADGQYLIFTACQSVDGTYGTTREGFGSCDLFFSQKVGDRWSRPMNMGSKINTNNWESQPCFAADGKSLYFIRAIKTYDGSKNSDIYVSTLGNDGYWSTPVALPDNINTDGMEASVMIHPDGQTLYFSSDGHEGMGGLDIFISRKLANGEWGDPVNLGYPINTHGEENSLLVSTKGDIAIFASDREGGFGALDLYSFQLPEEFQPQHVTYMKGHVFDKVTEENMEAYFQLIDVESGEVVVESWSNAGNGEFLVSLPANKDYALNVSQQGYLFFSKHFKMTEEGSADEPFFMDVPMIPIDPESGPVLLDNIFFDVDSYELREESFAELGKLREFLFFNKNVSIEISGHTDSDGDAKANQVLSENRAKSVVEWLIENGIAEDRLAYVGFGETQLLIGDDEIAAMATEEEKLAAKQANRRTEFRVTAN